MPLYEYQCERHGVFELTRPMAEASFAAPCPDCEGAAPRILSVPGLACLPAHVSKAHAVNERSRHEPKRIERTRPSPEAEATHDAPKQVAAHGRPWAIGH